MGKESKSLKEAKEKLRKNNPNFFDKRKESTKKIVKNKDIKKPQQKKKLIKWNYKVNDLVKIEDYFYKDKIGLIISDFEYMTQTVETNHYFVLISNNVVMLNGSSLRKL